MTTERTRSTHNDTCIQERNIGALQATSDAIKSTLEELKDGQERFITVLEAIASQGTKIEKHDQDINEMFGRLRKAETAIAVHEVKVGGISLIVSMVASSIIAYLFKIFGKG